MTGQSVFLDTNILVSQQTEDHVHRDIALKILHKAENKKMKLTTSNIVFDEFWYVLLGMASKDLTIKRKEIYEMLRKATNKVFDAYKIKLLDSNLTQKEMIETINLIEKYKLRPRDAIIVSIMKKNKVKYLATLDRDFETVKEITVLSC